MKRKLASVLTLLVAAVFFPVVSVRAAGITREVSVYLYRDYEDCVFFVSWENAAQSAAVQIKSPDGTAADADEQNAVFSRGGAAVSVGKASSGYWTVYVTGESLGSISVSGGSKNAASTQYNAIQSFTAEVSGGYINFKWGVIAEQDTVNVSITAAQGGNYGSRSLWSDYSAGKSGDKSVSADELQTGLYSFTIQVYDGKGQYTLTTDEPLYVKQSNAPAKLEGVKVGSIDGEMFATWNTRMNSGYSVTLYDYETLSVIKTEYAGSSFYPIALPDGVEKIKFSVAANDGSAYGEFDVFEIVLSTPSGVIVFPDYAATRESAVRISVDCLPDVTAGVYLDGTLLLENAGAGDYDLNLAEGSHEVAAYLKDKNGNMKTFSKSITVDKTPPIVTLNLPDSTKTASDSLVIEGNTEPNAVVSINGVEQALGSGGFLAKLALANGVNPITVAAYDTAGNKSVKTVTAERVGSAGGGWTVFLLPGLAFVLLSVWYVYLNRKARGAKPA